ncbi:MAG: hypothetical protein M1817_005524 [Caeruleum heppii]|nr:MAG: hypothetical protein M1817_005524 [Caeruleum heppii]
MQSASESNEPWDHFLDNDDWVEGPITTGGCCCGAIRYLVDFSAGENWTPDTQTCQCTRCRKSTGAITPTFITLHPRQFYWHDLDTDELPSHHAPAALREYHSSSGLSRFYCGDCGSSLCWLGDETDHMVELLVGTFDEECLIGRHTGDGLKREGGHGIELAGDLCKHFWSQNAIPGVTDRPDGAIRFVQGSRFGETIS